jgi:hypothetical protein
VRTPKTEKATGGSGLAELKRDDRRLLAPGFERLARDARSVASRIDDLWPSVCVDEVS